MLDSFDSTIYIRHVMSRLVHFELGRQHCPLMLAILLFGLISQTGCGGKETVQVSGHVQCKDGSPVPGAVRIIRFEPTGDSTAAVRKAASSDIAPDGRFELFTRKPGDGVYVGKYTVTFSALSSPLGGRSLIKPEYTLPGATPFVVEVTGDVSDLTYEIEMQ